MKCLSITEWVEDETMQKRMGEREVESGSEENDESTVETEVRMNEGPAEVEQETVSAVAV